ncbi:hypothetical protein BASA81_001821 [Batrachochytrium salamandrivorans]|nr:hypothetical protein BASA81_001821 [Batrachochytrium salamandrivorans]
MAKPKPSPSLAKPKKTPKSSEPEPDTLSPAERAASDFQATVGFYSLIIVPLLVALLVFPLAGFRESFHLDALPTKLTPHIVLLVLALSPPHLFYYWTWTHAVSWYELCTTRGWGVPYKTFALVAHGIKAFQFASLAIWAYSRVEWQDVITAHPLKLVVAAQLFVVGQVLNAKVYEKIGEAGVYYGTRLGVKVPWVYGFPFSVVPHPQYFGATLSFAGLFIALSTENAVREGVYIPMIAVAIMYAFSSWVEANL